MVNFEERELQILLVRDKCGFRTALTGEITLEAKILYFRNGTLDVSRQSNR